MPSHFHAIDTVRNRRRAPSVSVVVAAMDDEANLPHLFGALPRDLHQVILVDGRSVDDTVGVARRLRPDVVVVPQSRTGKGNAIAAGLAACTGDVVVLMDADGATDPAELPRLLSALVAGADLVRGSRMLDDGAGAGLPERVRRGTRALNALVNSMFRTHFTDLCCTYTAFWQHLVPLLDLPSPAQAPSTGGREVWTDGYELDTVIALRIAGAGRTVVEVPTVPRPRVPDTGDRIALRDGLRVLRAAIGEFRRRAGARRAGTPAHRAGPAHAAGARRPNVPRVSFTLARTNRYDAVPIGRPTPPSRPEGTEHGPVHRRAMPPHRNRRQR